jgi:hypothetical protein
MLLSGLSVPKQKKELLPLEVCSGYLGPLAVTQKIVTIPLREPETRPECWLPV